MSPDNPPLVSVAIPTYNGARYIDECLASAEAQTYPNLEIVVIDDDSRDETLSLVERHARRDGRIRIVRNRSRLGLSANFSACLSESGGEWVKYLLQDDLIAPTCVSEMMNVRRPGCPLVVCARNYLFEDVDEERRSVYEHVQSIAISSEVLEDKMNWIAPDAFADLVLRHLLHNFIGEPVAWLVERGTALRLGGFDTRLRGLVDLEFAIRLGTQHGVVVVRRELATFRCHPGQATATNLAVDRFHTTYLDPLLLLMRLAFSPTYADLRAAASGRTPPVDLERLARARAAGAWSVAHPRRDRQPSLESHWNETVRQDPIVGRFASDRRIRQERLRSRAVSLPVRSRSILANALRGSRCCDRAIRRYRSRRRPDVTSTPADPV